MQNEEFRVKNAQIMIMDANHATVSLSDWHRVAMNTSTRNRINGVMD
jgi:hypothetical protein